MNRGCAAVAGAAAGTGACPPEDKSPHLTQQRQTDIYIYIYIIYIYISG